MAPGCGDMGEKKKKKARERGKPQYFLACFPARPIPLEPGRVYSLGRGEGNSIVLPEQEVSRKQALITWDGVVLKDLGSSNGTFLNRRRVDEEPLKDDDKIGVGGRIFTFMVRPEKSVDRLVERARALKERGKTQAIDLSKIVPSQGLAGSLSDFGLPELLQTIDLNRKTGRLSLVTENKNGTMDIRGGQIVAAEFDGKLGEEAVYSMLREEMGYFEFEAKEFEVEPNVEASTSALLMESFRKLDESSEQDTKG